MFASLLWVILGLCYCSKESSQSHLGYPQLSGPSEALVKKVADFNCDLQIYPNNISITLEFYNEDKRKKLGEYTFAENGASFPMVIGHNHDGNLVCVAKAPDINATVSNVHYLKVIEPVKGAVIDVRSGPVEFFEGKTLELSCNHTAGTYVSYKWLLNGQLVSQALQYHNRLLINRTTSKDSGSYICMAFNEFNKTKFFNASSTEVVITVKDLVSRPDISFTVLKEDSHNYSAMVTCESAKGTPPVTFLVYSRTELVANMTAKGRNATFKFPLVLDKHMGYLQCQANNGNATEYSKWIPIEVEPVKGAVIDVRSGPVEFFEGKTLELSCNHTAGTYVFYKWLLNGQLVSQALQYHNRLLIYRTTSKDSGSYICMAFNEFNKTKFFNASSTEVVITVKDLVSRPDISFTVLKEDSHNYSAMVTCESAKGTPPVTFSLYNRTELVANLTSKDRNATFKVPLVLDKHMGYLQCQANNGDATEYSKWIPIEVVSVEGPVMMDYDYNVGESYDVVSLIIYCKAAKGSFPRYQWFLNKTLLDDRGSFYYVVHQPPQQSILMLSVGWSSAGTYHCSVSDSFDHTAARRSKRVYLDKHVLNRIPTLVATVVFGCFAAMILVVSVCCFLGVVFRRRHYGEKPLLEMESMVGAHEAELDLSEYNEDTDVLTAAKDAEFDQTSEASVDEWPQIEEEKKTLEDEPVEEP